MKLPFQYIFLFVLLCIGSIVVTKNADPVTGEKEVEVTCDLNKYVEVCEIKNFLFDTDACVIKSSDNKHKKKRFVGNYVEEDFENDEIVDGYNQKTWPSVLMEYHNVFDVSVTLTNRIQIYSLFTEKYIVIKERVNRYIKPHLFKVLSKNVHISEVVEYFVFCLRKIII
ncbi:MAG: hypothetical protein LBV74_02165 [Tannerella sp.]|jgi:hypothetical protein|nr:hypothetical protein [Tannerella sp.]